MFGHPHSQPADCLPWARQAHGSTPQESLMKTASDLTRSVRELVAQSAIRDGNAVVDKGSRRPRLLAGLEAHVIQECRLGEISFHDVAGVMNALPPSNEVQQVVSVGSQSRIR